MECLVYMWAYGCVWRAIFLEYVLSGKWQWLKFCTILAITRQYLQTFTQLTTFSVWKLSGLKHEKTTFAIPCNYTKPKTKDSHWWSMYMYNQSQPFLQSASKSYIEWCLDHAIFDVLNSCFSCWVWFSELQCLISKLVSSLWVGLYRSVIMCFFHFLCFCRYFGVYNM